jgi:uncharacterized membrane protein
MFSGFGWIINCIFIYRGVLELRFIFAWIMPINVNIESVSWLIFAR